MYGTAVYIRILYSPAPDSLLQPYLCAESPQDIKFIYWCLQAAFPKRKTVDLLLAVIAPPKKS